VEGPDLPDVIITEYANAISSRSPISSGDVAELTDIAKKLLKKHGFQPSEKSEEIFRLCLDCDVYVGHANRIRDYL
jgi:hypothetical protein